MCNYSFPIQSYSLNENIQFCDYYKLIKTHTSKDLTVLDEEGRCLFHSNHIKWKRKHNFYENLFILYATYEELGIEANLSGVHFIAKKEGKPIIDYLHKLLPCNLHGATFLDQVRISDKKIDHKLNLEYCNFRSDFFIENSSVNADAIFSHIDFYCETPGTFGIKNCTFNSSVDFCHTKIQGSLSIQDCHFAESFLFLDSQFTKDGLFEITGTFNDYTIFGNLEIFSSLVNFCDSTFNGETIFSNNKIQAEQQILFTNISVKKTLLFSGQDENRIFHSYTRFPLNLENIEGKITFQNSNLSNIDEEDRREIFRLQSTGKVIIERGCIKYRLQTVPRKILIDTGNQSLIDEITMVYSNFFISNTGYNLGVEIVERDKKSITLLYFSDENISQEEFIDLLEATSKRLLKGFIDFKKYLTNGQNQNYFTTAVMGIISWFSISLKVSFLITTGQWNEENTNSLINSISPNRNLISDEFHRTLSQLDIGFLQNIIEEKKLNLINIHQINQNGEKAIYIENNINRRKDKF
ncbi:hypothetical protein Q4Q35_05790 [Flavivirga aquimarina]|uniref:Pentapeptide repeat-containing protein n=1 Tax=Flavivirga aquimarina TaxID=2027862 RepID=A0ABT8W8D0_9FLAO|nr:hypothetical protein [Flavivirga aquimarina]MDO5969312.1 hypothetical protein [Flavivirga aquimarina]